MEWEIIGRIEWGGGTMKTSIFLGGLIIWALCVWKGRLELATFECSLYPISMFAAFIGTYTTWLVAKRIPVFLHPLLVWIGQNTLLILCYHTISYFVMTIIRLYFLKPNGLTINALESHLLITLLSLGLPYCHTKIHALLATKRTAHR